MSARDVLAEVLAWEFGSAGQEWADELLEALRTAGYRLLSPGELDDYTLERAAEIAAKIIDDGAVSGPAPAYPDGDEIAAAVVRALKSREGE